LRDRSRFGEGSDLDRRGSVEWPNWWEWELEVSSHVEKRMEQRDFTEVDLRTMLNAAAGYREDVVEGRWAIQVKHGGRPWEVIVEPYPSEELLVVVTAYPVDS
jgi:hypothetical protein